MSTILMYNISIRANPNPIGLGCCSQTANVMHPLHKNVLRFTIYRQSN